MENKKQNSLYLYTALIFLVALVMIIISFFGQKNLEKTNKAIQNSQSISEKSAAISAENVRLVEENLVLNNQITERDAKILELEAKIAEADLKISNYDLLMSAHSYFATKNYKKAKEVLDQVDFEKLEGDSKVLYLHILNEIE